MKYNTDYLVYLISGLILGFASIVVLLSGEAGGFIFRSKGREAFVNGGLCLLYAIYLLGQFFYNSNEKKVTWKDVGLMFVILWGIEIGVHFVFKLI